MKKFQKYITFEKNIKINKKIKIKKKSENMKYRKKIIIFKIFKI